MRTASRASRLVAIVVLSIPLASIPLVACGVQGSSTDPAVEPSTDPVAVTEPAAEAVDVPDAAADVPTKAGDGSGPVLEFENRFFDFGTHWITEVLEHTFDFTNTGDSDLVIDHLVPSCSACTVADYTKEPIPPGGKGTITVRLRADAEGVRNKTVDVFSNATDKRHPQRIQIRANFRQFFWIEPDTVSFGSVRQGESFQPQTTRVSWLAERGDLVKSLECDSPEIEITKTPFAEGEKKGFDLKLAVRDPEPLLAASNSNFFRATITLTTTTEDLGDRYIRMTGEVKPDVTVFPRHIIAKASDPKFPILCRLAPAPNLDVTVKDVQCSIPWLTTSPAERKKAGAGYIYIIKLDAKEGTTPEKTEGELVITTDYDRQPVFHVPVEFIE